MSLPPSRRASRWSLVALLALAMGACLAPTLPVPPPAQPDVSVVDAAGYTIVKGGKGSATADAIITVWNQTLSESAGCVKSPSCEPGVDKIVDTDGSWAARVPAKSKDQLYVWQTIGNEKSSPTPVVVP